MASAADSNAHTILLIAADLVFQGLNFDNIGIDNQPLQVCSQTDAPIGAGYQG